MKRQIYVLSGLACPNCAAKLQRAVAKLSGVHSAAVEFASGTLTIEHTGAEAVTAAIKQTLAQFDVEASTVIDA